MTGEAPAGPAPEITVVAVSYRSHRDLREALAFLWKDTEAGGIEAVVVNGSPEEDLGDLPAPPGGRLLVLEPGRNVGFAAGVNLGVREARGRYLLLLNPDCRVGADTVRRLAGFLAEEPEAAAVAPRLLDPDGSLQPSRGAFPSWWQTVASLLRLKALLPRDEVMAHLAGPRLRRRFAQWRPLEPVQAVDYATGACLLVRAEDFAAEGGFDERFFLFYEEIDLARRWAARRRRVYVLSDLTATHAVGGSSGHPAAVYGHRLRSMVRYFRKWEGPLATGALRAFLRPLLLIRRWGAPPEDRALLDELRRWVARPDDGPSPA